MSPQHDVQLYRTLLPLPTRYTVEEPTRAVAAVFQAACAEFATA